jgi:predicted XRE-type DNA-binding protein
MSFERDHPSEHYKLHLALSIYAQENLRPVAPQRQALMEAVNRQFSHAPMIQREIAEIQRRLGTPSERPDDMERAKVAAHQLANMLCTALLIREF